MSRLIVLRLVVAALVVTAPWLTYNWVFGITPGGPSAILKSPDGEYEALEVMGYSLLNVQSATWLRKAGSRGIGVQVTEWQESGVGFSWRWRSANELYLFGLRPKLVLLRDQWQGVSIRRRR